MTPLVEMVQAERKRRGWSIRRSAEAGGLSAQHWSQFEMGRQPCTDKVRLAVAKAFDWDEYWPADASDIDSMQAALDEALANLEATRQYILELRRRIRGLGGSAPTQATQRV